MEIMLQKILQEKGISFEEFRRRCQLSKDQAQGFYLGTSYPSGMTYGRIQRGLELTPEEMKKLHINMFENREAYRQFKYEKEFNEMKTGRKITYKTFFNLKKEERGYTVYDIQRHLRHCVNHHISINHLYNYLSGRELPPADVMEAFAKIFEVPFEEAVDHFKEDHENFTQDPKTLEEGKKSGYSARKKNEEIQTLENHFNNMLRAKKTISLKEVLEDNNNLLKDIDEKRNDIFIEVLRDRLIKMVDAAVFDDEPFAAERMDRLSDLYYQINCTLYILHRFKSKGNTPKIKECTLYEEQ